MPKRSKRYQALAAKVDRRKIYTLAEAIALVKETATLKFDPAVEIHVKLGIDPKKGEQAVRSSVVMPHGTGKKIRIAAIVTPDKEADARKAGADIVGGKDLIEQIKKDEKCDFAVAVANPGMMKDLAVIARILGQRGLMPNPKTGTVAEDVSKAIEALRKGQVTFRNDDTGNVHAMIGKASFAVEQLTANLEAFLDSLKKAKPEGLKGTYLQRGFLATSMGPSIRIQLS